MKVVVEVRASEFGVSYWYVANMSETSLERNSRNHARREQRRISPEIQ
jgi:hypothetical protein